MILFSGRFSHTFHPASCLQAPRYRHTCYGNDCSDWEEHLIYMYYIEEIGDGRC